ncbi:DUF4250 domain-containing protein [Clostridium saccharoperbutylacetonicum]|uniref:DUF4250 domain-containing protein n=1 Tax=Clostridium saccharoperbutylacetonicum N1-4(HMT) TaxID=931276 RepID=M1N612_9CLOT|nr:DUF4250 domain-containing protein [Clostridium saccharoperbutylacetonicum]AGF58832.1 hypothetical protein DUF4250 [Clostridium saccharoperbutylacetonicum N1-4(HMT)]AQR97513.1 hypothetical protein CLSAP_48380 [Clostridium saccharoperbutylacetonicum]NRT60384.1 hypothetical protein [Clostridium saccharoperbutylacetonicum]NSB23697.1 hypothetical protein [Clostridium saccharoperbutylacetonicum]NSB33397.1 hypothetical protein [Clostridium saccharoperbutylacetonicum]
MTRDSIASMDSNILLSIINMKLRDQYSSLNLLCDDLDIIEEDIKRKLGNIGYFYVEGENQFK